MHSRLNKPLAHSSLDKPLMHSSVTVIILIALLPVNVQCFFWKITPLSLISLDLMLAAVVLDWPIVQALFISLVLLSSPKAHESNSVYFT